MGASVTDSATTRRVSDIERKRLRDAAHTLQAAGLDVEEAKVRLDTARIAYARVGQDIAKAHDLGEGDTVNLDGTITNTPPKAPAAAIADGTGASE